VGAGLLGGRFAQRFGLSLGKLEGCPGTENDCLVSSLLKCYDKNSLFSQKLPQLSVDGVFPESFVIFPPTR
jgi:hypothetical protein